MYKIKFTLLYKLNVKDCILSLHSLHGRYYHIHSILPVIDTDSLILLCKSLNIRINNKRYPNTRNFYSYRNYIIKANIKYIS